MSIKGGKSISNAVNECWLCSGSPKPGPHMPEDLLNVFRDDFMGHKGILFYLFIMFSCLNFIGVEIKLIRVMIFTLKYDKGNVG